MATRASRSTLGQWIDSSGHRKNSAAAMPPASEIASARDAGGEAHITGRMAIAGDYEPKPGKGKGKREKEPLVAVKREAAPSARAKSSGCRIKVFSLCI